MGENWFGGKQLHLPSAFSQEETPNIQWQQIFFYLNCEHKKSKSRFYIGVQESFFLILMREF